jgi:hypothetical protein
VPDVPVSSFELYLPEGPHSALTTIGNLCNDRNLSLPTQFVAQNGAELNEKIRIRVTGCARRSRGARAKRARAHRATGRRAKRRRGVLHAHSSSSAASAPPTAITGAASAVSETGATLSGTVDRHDAATSYAFELGTSTDYGTTIAGTLPATAPETQSVSLAIDNLAPTTTYHYRLIATNAAGTGLGADESFTTPGPEPTFAAPATPAFLPLPAVAFPTEPSAEALPAPAPHAKTKKAKAKRHRGHRARGHRRGGRHARR